MIPYFPQPSLDLGPVAIHAFGVLVVVAIFVGLTIVSRRADRQKLDHTVAERLVSWILLGGFLGAHLVHRVFYAWPETAAEPWKLLAPWLGFSSTGGFLGGIAGAALFLRRERLGVQAWRYLDTVAYAFPFAWVFGRLGCFVAFDHPGLATDSPLGQEGPDGIVRHNLGLEEALYTAGIAVVFAILGRRAPGKVGSRAGFWTALLPVLYAPGRFALDFLRMSDTRYVGLTPAQWGAMGLFFVGVLLLVRLATRRSATRWGFAAAAP